MIGTDTNKQVSLPSHPRINVPKHDHSSKCLLLDAPLPQRETQEEVPLVSTQLQRSIRFAIYISGHTQNNKWKNQSLLISISTQITNRAPSFDSHSSKLIAPFSHCENKQQIRREIYK